MDTSPLLSPTQRTVFLLVCWGVGIYLLIGAVMGFSLGSPVGGLCEGLLGVALLFAGARSTRTGLTTRTPLPPRVLKDPLPGGVELEAEVLGRYEAGAAAGSDDAKRRQPLMSSWDPLELELRYSFDGREIVSRRPVSVETFFHTRGMKMLRIKVRPDRPEDWAVYPAA